MNVIIYRSKVVNDMYLFVAEADELERVPNDLLRRFGRPVESMRIEITTERKLARADATRVLAAIDDAGFYLQMPPQPIAQEPKIVIPDTLHG